MDNNSKAVNGKITGQSL
jgi:hypothetical protein